MAEYHNPHVKVTDVAFVYGPRALNAGSEVWLNRLTDVTAGFMAVKQPVPWYRLPDNELTVPGAPVYSVPHSDRERGGLPPDPARRWYALGG
ncbi:MAG TPA: hypothetical protein VHU91_04930 [Mycobacteriales bacterium]|nr:hypothetical protein [Mycobacteriales bacterium]